MATKNFSVSQDKSGTYLLQGELTIHDLEELKDFLEKALKGGKKKNIVISFAEVGFIDTAVLQLLVAFKRWIEPDVELKISALSAEVEDILSLTGLKTAFF
ncbi:MAG: STAS domain-containing protein [Deltaproteobacteria bacterium]|nr:STAS domain-containing protein [Deltaproteobacteria bacterium]MBW2170952.1 STAS domain-containing protein [Deltaproteobacteria bacterium]